MNRAIIDRLLIYGSSFLRSFTIGMIAVLMAIFLTKLGFSKTQIGVVVSVGLVGAAAGNLLVTFFGDRFGRRNTLILYAILSAVGTISICFFSNFYAVLVTAFFGMINARGKDRGAALVVESAILPNLESNQCRTKAFAWYSFIMDIGLAVGGIAAGLPALFVYLFEVPELVAYKIAFGCCALLMLVSGILYFNLSNKTEVPLESVKFKFSPEGKKVVTKLCGLFAIDSLAGGFLTSALIAYYFYERFDVNIQSLGVIFFIARCLNAVSNAGAVWISKKIGLVNAMVFTHSPSHLFLIAIAFAPNFPIAVAFFLIRELLVEMDVPTRQSYIMAIVKPEERVKTGGITLMVRLLGWSVAPTFAGFIMQEISLASPLFFGAGIKLTYDALLYFSFRKLKPPEEPIEGSEILVESNKSTEVMQPAIAAS